LEPTQIVGGAARHLLARALLQEAIVLDDEVSEVEVVFALRSLSARDAVSAAAHPHGKTTSDHLASTIGVLSLPDTKPWAVPWSFRAVASNETASSKDMKCVAA
jgi:hypothetical protein